MVQAAPSMDSREAEDLPELRFGADFEIGQLYDVKFYPWTTPGGDSVFAAAYEKHVVVCRLTQGVPGDLEVIAFLEEAGFIPSPAPKKGDKQEAGDGHSAQPSFNSIAWTKNPNSLEPWLCVVGMHPSIRVLDVASRTVVRTLNGHGAPITDLKVCPTDSTIIASCSEDHEVRLWTLRDQFAERPCLGICAGIGGHRMPVLSIGFHSSGRYLLSGGMDNYVNMWAVPGLPEQVLPLDRVAQMRFPHFSTCEIHSNRVDCVMFHHDLVLSKSAEENRIVLWRIRGFTSENSLGSTVKSLPAQARGSSGDTRSAFGTGWDQLLVFDAPNCRDYYMRFALFNQPSHHPVLVIGNNSTEGRVYFWDLYKLEHGVMASSTRKPKKKPTANSLRSVRETESPLTPFARDDNPGLESIGGSQKKQAPHKTVVLPSGFCTFQCAWSAGGEWCVSAGSATTGSGNNVRGVGQLYVLGRWSASVGLAGTPSESVSQASTPAPGVPQTSTAGPTTPLGGLTGSLRRGRQSRVVVDDED